MSSRVLALLVRDASVHERNTQAGPTRPTYAGAHAALSSLGELTGRGVFTAVSDFTPRDDCPDRYVCVAS